MVIKAIIYHNPRCSKSRQALQLLQERGCEVEVVLYLKDAPDAQTLAELAARTDGGVRTLLREKEPAFREWQLADETRTETELLDALVREPKLLNRPVVRVGNTVIAARPPERVLELLPDDTA